MKKTFLILLLSAVSMAHADQFTTTNSSTTTASNLWYNGIVVNLDPTIENSRIITMGEGFSSMEEVSLISFTANMRGLDYGNGTDADNNQITVSAITLALTDSTGVVKALSTNTISTVNSDQTWNFANTTISTTEDLYFVFVDSSVAGLSVGYTLQSSDMVTVGGGTNGLINYGNQLGGNSLVMLGNNQSHNLNIYNYNAAPKISIVTEPISVPEPATATLGLLALTGLAARRRRK